MLKKSLLVLLSICILAIPVDCAAKKAKPTMTLKHFKQRVKAKGADYKKRPVIIVAFGDSVTMGATKANTFDFDNVYHARLKKLLEEKYPKTVFSVINSGVGGEKAHDGLKRIKRDVIQFKPDLVIIGFGLNDVMAGKAGLARYKKSLEATIAKIKKQSKADIILLTPNFMNTSDNPNVNASHRKLGLPMKFAKLQNNGTLKLYANAVKKIGKKYSIPVADVYGAWQKLAKTGVDTNTLLANGLNHPTGETHEIPAQLIFKCINH